MSRVPTGQIIFWFLVESLGHRPCMVKFIGDEIVQCDRPLQQVGGEDELEVIKSKRSKDRESTTSK